MSDETPVLLVDGLVETPLAVSYDDFLAIPESDQIADVSRLVPGRKGDGVTLASILSKAGLKPEANYITLHADRDDFHVSIPLAPVLGQAILVYRVEGAPMPIKAGGPFRLLIQDTKACHTGELDECANVKYLSRIELTIQKGRDTRPADEAEHAALHAAEQH